MADENQESAPSAENVLKAFEAEAAPAESAIPEKFRGKSLEEVVTSYQELEKQLGKQGQELGELRKTYDAYIRSEVRNRGDETAPLESQSFNISETQEPRHEPVRSEHPSDLGHIQAELHELRRERFLSKLEAKHSDYDSIVNNPEFVDFVKESPARVELFRRADQGFDLDSAGELFDMWREKHGTAVAAQAQAEEAFEQAKMDVGTPNNPVSTQKFRRADIRDLAMRDPARYKALEPEIRRAYAEGRVI